jgi:hypothetical protein
MMFHRLCGKRDMVPSQDYNRQYRRHESVLHPFSYHFSRKDERTILFIPGRPDQGHEPIRVARGQL